MLTKHNEFNSWKSGRFKAFLSFTSLHERRGLLNRKELSSLTKHYNVLLHRKIENRQYNKSFCCERYTSYWVPAKNLRRDLSAWPSSLLSFDLLNYQLPTVLLQFLGQKLNWLDFHWLLLWWLDCDGFGFLACLNTRLAPHISCVVVVNAAFEGLKTP